MRAAPSLVFLALLSGAAPPILAAGGAWAAPSATADPKAADSKAADPKPSGPKAPAPVRAPSQDQLFSQLARAQSAEEAHPIEQKLLTLFRASGSPSIDLLMNRAEVAAAAGDRKMATKLLDSVTAIAPKFAEGWHARAALETASGDDAAAMVSLQKAVLLNPRQFNALNELAQMLEDYGDKAGALKLYRRALALDPQLEGVERHVRALAREVEGQDI